MVFGRKSRKLGAQSGTETLRLREKMITITDDFWVEDDDGNRRFTVKGTLISYRDSWSLLDPDGNTVAVIREKKMAVRDSVTIELGPSKVVVRKAMIGIRDRFNISGAGTDDISIQGDVISKEYVMSQKGGVIATVSRKWFRVRDTYGVQVADSADSALVVAVAVALDSLTT